MISFFPSRKIETKCDLCNCTNCTQGDFNDCVLDKIDKINVDKLLPLDNNDVQPEMFTFIEENTYIAVTAKKRLWNCSMLSRLLKNVLLMRILLLFMDTYRKGVYCKGYYLEKISEKKLYIRYKQFKKMVYFYPNEVFSPCVPINEDLCLSLAEYQFLSDSI